MNQPTKVYSIVPRLPPAIDGVGDYALNLARQLRKDFNVPTHFIVGNPTWQGASEIEGFPVSHITNSSINQLIELLGNDLYSPVLLHYVGYGYDKQGCPVWLADGLQRWKDIYPYRILVTMFHEIYASSYKPWTSSFWNSPVQKHIASQLIRLTDRAFTSCQVMAEKLAKISVHQKPHIQKIPVFSNIGELTAPARLTNRERHLVVFGHPNSRLQVYKDANLPLKKVCSELQIERIYDIGVPIDADIKHLTETPIISLGKLPAHEISKLLANSLAAFIKFPPSSLLAKSTVFASYCSHGILVLKFNVDRTFADGLEANKHYFVVTRHSCKLNIELGQTIADKAFEWYKGHDIASQAKIFAESLNLFLTNV